MRCFVQCSKHLSKATTPKSPHKPLTLLPICSWTHTHHLNNGSYLIVPVNATWTTDLWAIGFSITMIFPTHSSIACHLDTTIRLQFIPHWFSLEMIHTPFHPISLTNHIPTLHVTLYLTQSEFSEIHPNSLFTRTIRSTIQYPQGEMKYHPKPFFFPSFSPSPLQNNQMNRWNSNTTNRNRNRYLVFHS